MCNLVWLSLMLHMRTNSEDDNQYDKFWANMKILYLFCEIIFKNDVSKIRITNFLRYK